MADEAIVTYKKKQKTSATASVGAIAKEFNVPRSTLQDHLDGALPCNQAHKLLMHWTRVEETDLVDWITTLTHNVVMLLGIIPYENWWK